MMYDIISYDHTYYIFVWRYEVHNHFMSLIQRQGVKNNLLRRMI